MQHKLNMVDARRSRVDAVRVGGGERRVDADEVPTRSSGTGGKIKIKDNSSVLDAIAEARVTGSGDRFGHRGRCE